MKILAIETSTRNLSIAVADENSILAEYKGDSVLRHSQDLIPNIEILLKKTGLGLADIDCFAVSIGPGSFTGLRVGVSIIKGLNMVTNIPIVTVPTLDVIACNVLDTPTPICVILDAKKKNIYSSLYRVKDGDIIRTWDYLLVPPDELIERIDDKDEEILFLGDAISFYGDLIRERLKNAKLADRKYWFPDAKRVARLGRNKFKRREFEDADGLVPMYMYSRECNVRGIDR
ncbi:MAG: tRNA (adenosine(37)-N6)-threonylcarbamoyltransferase complex dimerization subunit type 1 TsaB [Candidatus Omnitrophica bacterium]|nr:tRNA (adenosine(37)-N6)-threonylcarbamoyltransferase complex dimerization subunit type 1 TsaB [Candidatus Omnitrophota bacterium]